MQAPGLHDIEARPREKPLPKLATKAKHSQEASNGKAHPLKSSKREEEALRQ